MTLHVEDGKTYETESGILVCLRRNSLPYYCFSAAATNGVVGDTCYGETWAADGTAYHNDCGFNLKREVPEAAPEITQPAVHVDDWLDRPAATPDEAYAKFVLDYLRKPAWAQIDFEPWMGQHKLFCHYNGKPHRVTGASRLGDVWLREDPSTADGYDYRVPVMSCSQWRSTFSV